MKREAAIVLFSALLSAADCASAQSPAPAPNPPQASSSAPAASAPQGQTKKRAAAPKPEASAGDRLTNFFRSNGEAVAGGSKAASGTPAAAKPKSASAAAPAGAAAPASAASGATAKEQMANRALASYSTSSNALGFGLYRIVPKEEIAFKENYAPGTIIVRQRERRLYYVLGSGKALKYAIAVGREGSAWSGTSTVSAKREWPDWTPTPAILQRQPDLPRHVEGGPGNPLGARALYLGGTMYRIHGTNEPWRIGEEASSGCIRLTNDDIIDLYDRTKLGATVVVQR